MIKLNCTAFLIMNRTTAHDAIIPQLIIYNIDPLLHQNENREHRPSNTTENTSKRHKPTHNILFHNIIENRLRANGKIDFL